MTNIKDLYIFRHCLTYTQKNSKIIAFKGELNAEN